MLLRREFTVNGNRGSSGLCSALVPMSPVHEIRLQPNNSQQQGPTLKSRIQIWSLGRPIVYQSLPAVRAPHCPSPGHLSAGNNSSAEDTQPLKGTADDMSQYAQRSLLANKSMVQAAWKAPAPIKIWRTRSSLRRSNNALRVDVAQRNQDTRHGFEKRPLPRPIFYKDFWKTIVDDSNEIKDMIEDVVPWHSPLGLHLWDLRDELLCTAQTIDSLLKQCAALYLPREAVDAFRWKDKDDNVSIVKGACGAGLVHSTTSLDDQHFRIVRREFRQSRHLISHYTRVIDRFYRRRGMRGMMDGIFKRIDPLYTTIDPPGRGAENGTDGDQPASNVRLRRMLTASNELKRTLYALQQFFEDLRHYRELLPANARDLTRGGTDEFRVLLGEFDKIVWRQAKSGYSHKPTEPSESSWAGESTQKPSPEFHGTVTQLQSSSETSTRSGENNEGMALLPSQDTENLGVVSSSKRRRTDMSPLFLDERSRRTRFPDFRGPVVHSSSFKETTNQPKGDSGDTAPVKEVPQDSSPVYLSVEGKEGNDFHAGPVKHLLQTSWPKTPLFHSSTPLTSSPNIRSASKPRVAAFHTSAAARRPPATAFAPRETEESDEVSRSNEASEHQCGSPLGYRIPSATMRESMLASRTSRSAYWQYTFYEGPKGEKVKVHYCKSLETTERISKLFLNESVIGFDIEWKPQAMAKDGIRKNVAMIQLASEERIALFHVARFSKGDEIDDLVAPSFRHIMESDAITKVGVSVKSDCSRLRKFLGIDSRGLFELSHLYKLVKFATNDVKRINKLLVSLAKQVEEHLMLPLYKDGSVRASDWSEELDYQQIYCIVTHS